jgi:hypothetical protein
VKRDIIKAYATLRLDLDFRALGRLE